MQPDSPELVLEVNIERFGLKAFLVIDRLVWGRSWGGLRIVPDPSREETIAIAQTMTLKYGYIGLPMGGAKAALQLPLELESSRRLILFELGGKLSREIQSGKWIPALDMGTSIQDVQDLYQGAGMNVDLSSWTYHSAAYTAWSAFCSTRSALQMHREPVAGTLYVIQGFGRVGMEYSRLMSSAGARLIGISTRRGAKTRRDGFDVNELVYLRTSQGDSFLLDYDQGDNIDPEQILELESDIAVPCARAWAIRKENWERVHARIIPCVANAAMHIDVERRLNLAGKTVITDFVANCGGVFGSILEKHVRIESIYRLLEKYHTRRVDQLLHESAQEGLCMTEIAARQANRTIASFERRNRRFVMDSARRALPALPAFLREPMITLYASRSFFRGTA